MPLPDPSTPLSHCLSFLRSVAAFAVDGPLLGVVFLAIVSYHLAKSISPRSPWPRRLGLLAASALCLHGFMALDGARRPSTAYLSLGIRSLLAVFIVEGASAVVLALCGWVWSGIASVYRLFGKAIRWLYTRMRRAFAPRPPVAPPPPPPPSLKSRLDDAKREFEKASDALRSAGLDADELESALTLARQKFTRRLNEEMKR